MDRSFLSQPEVISASRAFVCVRLATYENAEEAAFLKGLARTGSGELENTVFGIMAPDGKTKLSRAARSPDHAFRDAADMAAALQRIAKQFDASRYIGKSLPLVANVKLAINIAAADKDMLVVAYATDAESVRQLEDRLNSAVWNDSLIGRFVFASTTDAKQLNLVEGAKASAGYLLVEPERFGRKAGVVAQLEANIAKAELNTALKDANAARRLGERNYKEHIREGQRLGVFWVPQTPVTDPMERQARERTLRMSPKK
ncbi:MAG: thioredoxin family protein [Gemmataceae bacterium]